MKTKRSFLKTSVNLSIASKTDTGLSRVNNEDALLTKQAEISKNIAAFMIVADGVGGNSAGEIASELAVKQFSRYVSTIDDSETNYEKFLKDTLNKLNSEIIESASEDPQKWGMSTTVACAIIVKDKLYVAWVGDSRVYIVREGIITQITSDHSYVNELLKTRMINEEQARTHSQRNVITRSLGKKLDLEVDTKVYELHNDDYILICSDGLTEHLTDDEIAYEICSQRNPDKTCDSLVANANARGGKDNISVIVVQYNTKSKFIVTKQSDLQNSEPNPSTQNIIVIITAILVLILALAINFSNSTGK